MLKFTLLKNLYYELDPNKMPGVKEVFSGDNHYRTLELVLEDALEITSMTMIERYMPYSTLYYLHLNGNRQAAQIEDPEVRIFLAAFYRHYFPHYLVENAPQDAKEIASTDILTMLDPDKMPGYQNRHALRELVTLDEIRNGKTGDEHKTGARFPGLRFADKYKPR